MTPIYTLTLASLSTDLAAGFVHPIMLTAGQSLKEPTTPKNLLGLEKIMGDD